MLEHERIVTRLRNYDKRGVAFVHIR